MNASILRVPASVASDASDVAVALEVAGALWEKGDNEEAIRWVRRAGEAAGQAGDAPRAESLTAAAGELQSALGRSGGEGAREAPPPTEVPPPGAPGAHLAMGGAPLAAEAMEPAAVAAAPRSLRPGEGGRLRVSVKVSIRDPNLFLLRPLAEGQGAPAGTREGFLVLAEIPSDGNGHKNGGGRP